LAKVLVVDDEKDMRDIMEFLLQKEGHQVVTAFNGKVALEVVDSARPDLIVMDIMMPEMDGYTAQSRLFENPDTRSIPVIILTSKSKTKDLLTQSSNVVSFLEKPFDPKTLVEKVREVLKNGNNGK